MRMQPTPFAVKYFSLSTLNLLLLPHVVVVAVVVAVVVIVTCCCSFCFVLCSLVDLLIVSFDCRRGLNLSFTWSALIRTPTETESQM